MISIPSSNKKFSQPNNSDLFGNIWYSKNVNFDEEGYVRLSSRAVSIYSESTDGDFALPLSFGRILNGDFNIAVSEHPYQATISDTLIQVYEDVRPNVPGLSINSWGRWWQNRWHVSTETEIWYFDTTSNFWINTMITLSSGVTHPLEVFRNKNLIAVGDGNTVKLYDTSYALQETLTLPVDYEVVGLAYSSNKLGIITRLSSDAEGQNQDAFFFVWDGGSAEANSGFPVGADAVESIVAYKSSWIIITRAGEFKYFNGGGFDTLTTLPFVFLRKIWGDAFSKNLFGDAFLVDGEKVYTNANVSLSPFGEKRQQYLPNNPSGVLCYDKNVGMYCRYTPSISPVSLVAVQSSQVDPSTGIFTITSGTIPPTGNPVKYTKALISTIDGLLQGHVYYVIRLSDTTFRLSATRADALNGVFITPSFQPGSSSYFCFLNVLDYGASKIESSGGVGMFGNQTNVYDHLIFGNQLMDADGSSNRHLSMTMPGMPSRGYVVTAKTTSANVEDIYRRVFLKYRPLKTDEKIIVKYKNQDISAIPVTTPQQLNLNTRAIWTSDTVFTTTSNIQEVLDAISAGKEFEAEIIGGAGAGQMPQISSITVLSGTYTVTLAESVEGVSEGNYSNISIDNWTKAKEVTDADTDGHVDIPVENPSKWIMVKIEMRGSDIVIEEAKIINSTQLKAE